MIGNPGYFHDGCATNVAHEEIDLKNPKTNRKNAGFSDEERAKMTELLSAGFIDTFRYFHPDKTGEYEIYAMYYDAANKLLSIHTFKYSYIN